MFCYELILDLMFLLHIILWAPNVPPLLCYLGQLSTEYRNFVENNTNAE